MQVFTRTISSVFGQEKRYVIPLFQRPYVWTEDAQWAPLWDDIVDRAEQELVPQRGDVSPHFLGAIVIQQRKTFGDQLLAHDVIDGQQRLTTFQILLAAFRDIAAARSDQNAPWLVMLTKNANALVETDVDELYSSQIRTGLKALLKPAGGTASQSGVVTFAACDGDTYEFDADQDGFDSEAEPNRDNVYGDDCHDDVAAGSFSIVAVAMPSFFRGQLVRASSLTSSAPAEPVVPPGGARR